MFKRSQIFCCPLIIYGVYFFLLFYYVVYVSLLHVYAWYKHIKQKGT